MTKFYLLVNNDDNEDILDVFTYFDILIQLESENRETSYRERGGILTDLKSKCNINTRNYAFIYILASIFCWNLGQIESECHRRSYQLNVQFTASTPDVGHPLGLVVGAGVADFDGILVGSAVVGGSVGFSIGSDGDNVGPAAIEVGSFVVALVRMLTILNILQRH